MGDPWKPKKKPGRPPYAPKVVVITKASKDKFGAAYTDNERTVAVNKRLVKVVGVTRLPAKGTLEEMSKKIPEKYYKRFRSRVG